MAKFQEGDRVRYIGIAEGLADQRGTIRKVINGGSGALINWDTTQFRFPVATKYLTKLTEEDA